MVTIRHSFDPEELGLMNLFEAPSFESLSEMSSRSHDTDTHPATDLALLHKLLEIYDQGQLAEILNDVSPTHWCRETINRWIKGKASPKLSHMEFTRLEALLPKRLNHKPSFTFIDLERRR